jgi:uncharacterized UPF0160 family protein
MQSLAVHDGSFHADDVFAAAIMRMLHPGITIVRSRDQAVLDACDLRIDVGNKYCPESGDFDHHMAGGAGEHKNGVPYAACGLIWKHFGMEVTRSRFVFNHIEKKIIVSIDAIDNGFSIGEEDLPFKHYNLSDMVESFAPVWNDENMDFDAHFMQAVGLATVVLKNEIKMAQGYEQSRSFVRTAIEQSTDPRLVIMDRYCPWKDIVVNESQALYIIFPATAGDWRICAVPTALNTFYMRKPLPRKWGGKPREELAALTGVTDVIFCHPACFIAVARTREGVLRLAELALNT